MKIKKYVAGGVYTGFNVPLQTTKSTGKSKSEGSSGSSKSPDLPFTKELIDLIASEGLASDSTVFSQKLSELLYRAQVTGTDLPAYMTVALANEAVIMKQMKSKHDEAEKQVIEKGTGNDIATHGYFMYAEDLSKPEEDREIALITPDQFLESPSQWKILTNQEILHLREFDPNLAFETSTIISDAATSTNLTKIRELWVNQTKALATQSASGVLQQDVQMQDYVTGALMIQKAKGSIDSSTTMHNSHVQNYLTSLYTTMDEKSKGYLHAYMATKGLAANEKNILTFMYSTILDYISTNSDYSVGSGTGGSGNGGSGSGSGDISGVTEDNQAMRIQAMQGPKEIIAIKAKPSSPSGEMAAFQAVGTRQGKFIKQNGDFVKGPVMINTLMGEAQAFAACDNNSIYFGIKKLYGGTLQHICWDGLSEIYTVDLPAITEKDGTVRPWLELMGYLGEINAQENIAPFEVSAFLKKKGIDPEKDVFYNTTTGKWELKVDTIPFLTFQAYAGTDKISFSNNELQYLEDVPDKEAEHLVSNINASYGGTSWFEYDDDADEIIAGNIYIPIQKHAYTTFNATANQPILKADLTNFGRRSEAITTLNGMQTDPQKKDITVNFTK